MTSKPVWYIFPGSNSLPSDPKVLLTFAPLVELCEQFRISYGIDLLGNLKKQADCLETSTGFALITATHISLISALSKLGIAPDGYIGYSIGEFACAYVDNCYDLMETLLLSYNIGRAVEEGRGVKGLMAKVYCNRSKLPLRCEEKVYVAVEDAPNMTTISGPKSDVQKCMKRLYEDNLTAKPIDSFGNALHCPEMNFLWDTAKESLYKIISVPKVRSEAWISTSPSSKDDYLRLACPRYFVRSLTLPVLFSEAVKNIPDNAMIIEMSYDDVLGEGFRENLVLPTKMSSSRGENANLYTAKQILAEGCLTTG